MSNPAQEEADRIFNYKPSVTSHPEDKGRDSDADTNSADEHKSRARTIRSGRNTREDEDQDQDTDDDDDDDELAAKMATMATNKTSYTVPSTVQYANTGPKGVIADAQNYERARKGTFRRTLNSISDTLSFGPSKRQTQAQKPGRSIRENDTGGNSSGSDIDLEDDDDFMAQWRQQRLAELQEQFSPASQSQSQSPSRRRTYGALESVNANGYLNAIESSPKSTHVVVFLHDPKSEESLDVEDELKMLAYRYDHVRFVRMHHEIADMETVEIPALLAYRGGDVFVTMSGVERDGLEDRLRNSGVLVR